MDKLMKRLQSTLLENESVEIKHSAIWYLPITRMEVQFSRVRRSKMDILMKMMLVTFEEATIRRAANVAEMLLVEELFIEDLLEKMQRTGLIRLESGIYQLTAKGNQQLETGITEEELEDEWTELLYCSDHDGFWPELTIPESKPAEDFIAYRYTNEQNAPDSDQLIEVLSVRENKLDEDGFQTVVSEVLSSSQHSIEFVPCLEFQLYNKDQDLFYSRVWNGWLERWDDAIEKQIEEHERLQWREKWIVESSNAEKC
ncbi:hypothetical protein [Bacillus suaedae]|uniref:Uncharacterized protein n=1 Tax=Halalkalibacter suaedae TaxID=2822140 RepID=A0A940WSD2_9BACI|nr:hypothetical protein [Bacillus suaedae]MBP3951605.1 hypothetical protein [Bacillus suaedae]